MIDLIVGSPPFLGAHNGVSGLLPRSKDGKDNGAVAIFKRTGKWADEYAPESQEYGQTPGQLGGMKEGQFNPGDTMNKEKTRECVFDEWNGLYSEGWQGVIVEDAFAH